MKNSIDMTIIHYQRMKVRGIWKNRTDLLQSTNADGQFFNIAMTTSGEFLLITEIKM